MKISLSPGSPHELATEVVAIPVAAGESLQGTARELDEALGGLVREVLDSGEHRGRLHELLPLPTFGRLSARRLLLYGLGPPEDLDGQRLRFAHHEMIRGARGYGYRRVAVARSAPLTHATLAGVVEGCLMGAWDRRSRATGHRPAPLEELVLQGFGEGREGEVAAARQLGLATNRAREWQNAPAGELTPDALAEAARSAATRFEMEIEVLGAPELRAGGYNLLLGVAAGSEQPPRLIRLEHRGAEGGPKLALIGKGVTYDSGGLSIKTAEGMRTMRGDMAGAAAVLAAMEVIGERRLPINVMGVVGATENMISGRAQKPGDVVTGAAGKTVEVANTDAEGRLVLADAITFAIRRGATHLIDLATLTGSATVAVGHGATAAVSNDDDLWNRVLEAAELAGDRVWRLPILADYRTLLSSRVADLKNSYYGEAGTITGGMFIQQFVEDRPWVHLDIAASSWNENADLTTIPRGPLGAGTRLLVRLAELTAISRR